MFEKLSQFFWSITGSSYQNQDLHWSSQYNFQNSCSFDAQVSKQLVTSTRGLNPGDTEYLRICSKGGPSNQLCPQHYHCSYAPRGKKKVTANVIKSEKDWNLKWIAIKILEESTGNSAQCYMAAWMGKEFEGDWIHMHMCHWALFLST